LVTSERDFFGSARAGNAIFTLFGVAGDVEHEATARSKMPFKRNANPAREHF
jgi:hypothetical protein